MRRGDSRDGRRAGVHRRSKPDGLLHTTYGQLIIAKTVLLLVLIGLGWVNRYRVIPGLERIAKAGESPGATGVLARRTCAASSADALRVRGDRRPHQLRPADRCGCGPFSTNTTLGPAELEMTVEPAEVGLNTVHLYLIDAKTGAQYTATKELTGNRDASL